MEYFIKHATNNGLILSCDMLRLSFKVDTNSFKQITLFLKEISIKGVISYEYYESRAYYNFRNLFKIVINFNKSVFSLGLGFNGSKTSEKSSCFIEFNPNKCLFHNSILFEILGFIKVRSAGFDFSRFDLAVDIPVKRSLVCLLKDLRNYRKNYYLVQDSLSLDNVTEYLGQRNKNGFVKAYNKKLEQKLDYDLTRIEITLDSFDFENFNKHFPKIVYLKNLDLITYNSLNDTDKVLVSLLLENVNVNIYLKALGRVKQEKISNIILNSVMLDIGLFDFLNIVNKIKNIYM